MSKILNILKETHALITNDHFVYTSGKHGSTYINKDLIFTNTEKVSQVGQLFAEKFSQFDVDVVAGPALGGIILSQWTAYHLTKLKKKIVFAVYTEKTPDMKQIFTRGYDKIVKNKKIVVVEDLTTTGGSVKKVVDSIKSASGKVIAVGVMIDRSPNGIDVKTIGAPFFALDTLSFDAYEAGICPLCRKDIPINTSVGHGKKFIASK